MQINKENNSFVIYVCGLFGTKLYKGNDIVWPPTNSKILEYCFDSKIKSIFKLFSKKKTKFSQSPETLVDYLNLLADKNLTTGTLTDNYTNIIDFIKKSTNGNYYIFNYDWRLPLKESVAKLAKEIEQLDVKEKDISIWSHSAGGVIAFEYLNNFYKENEEPDNFKQIKRYVTMGCPIKGSVLALTSIIGLNFQTLLPNHELKRIIEKNVFNSIYDLIPNNIHNIFHYKDSKKLLTPEEVYEVLIVNGFDKNKLNDALMYRQEFKNIQQNPNVSFTFIVGSYSDKSICTSFAVDPDTKELTCEYSRGCSDGTVLITESIPNDNYSYKTKYVSGKHAYLTECDDVIDFLSEEIFFTDREKFIVNAVVLKENDKQQLEFLMFYEKNGKQHVISKVKAEHICFTNKTVSSDITDLFERNKKSDSFSFKTNYKYGTLKLRNATIFYKPEPVSSVCGEDYYSYETSAVEIPNLTTKDSAKLEKSKDLIKFEIKELYVDINNPIVNTLI